MGGFFSGSVVRYGKGDILLRVVREVFSTRNIVVLSGTSTLLLSGGVLGFVVVPLILLFIREPETRQR